MQISHGRRSNSSKQSKQVCKQRTLGFLDVVAFVLGVLGLLGSVFLGRWILGLSVGGGDGGGLLHRVLASTLHLGAVGGGNRSLDLLVHLGRLRLLGRGSDGVVLIGDSHGCLFCWIGEDERCCCCDDENGLRKVERLEFMSRATRRRPTTIDNDRSIDLCGMLAGASSGLKKGGFSIGL